MDLTVEVMLPPRGTDFTVEMGNNHYRVLSPVAVYLPRKVVETVGMQHTGYLHVTGFPDNHPSFRQVSREGRQQRLSTVLGEFWLVPDVLSIEPRERLQEKRTWAGNPQLLPPPVRNALITDRQAEITWGQFKALMRHQVRQVNLTDDDI
jgi:hypothetical protein